jgi:hypothetical protein
MTASPPDNDISTSLIELMFRTAPSDNKGLEERQSWAADCFHPRIFGNMADELQQAFLAMRVSRLEEASIILLMEDVSLTAGTTGLPFVDQTDLWRQPRKVHCSIDQARLRSG